MTESKDADQIIGGAIIASLSKMFDKQIKEDGVSPRVIVRSLNIVARSVGSQYLGFKSSAELEARARKNLN